jgi:lysophospholipase L1-like esterase
MKLRTKWFGIGLVIVILAAGLVAFFFETQSRPKKPVNTIHVACVGDSITNGTEYPDDLWMMLGANYTVGNFGVGGATVSLQSGNSYMNQSEFRNAEDFMPNIVVIMLGTNDAYSSRQQNTDNFINDYKALIGGFQALSTKPKIWIVVPPPIFIDNLGPDNTILVKDIIPRIDQTATELGLPTIDVYSQLVNHPEYFWDGVHPNNQGAKIIASEIYGVIV